jgi:predicted protein tyrosine phosphatase
MIHVCSLARLPEMIARTGAHHVVSLLAKEDNLICPAAIAAENHLWLQVHDITEPAEGYVMPQQEHVEELIAFVKRWPREKPLIIHCYAGISRSTAAAFVAVCALNPASDERNIATALRIASPTATPNVRIVTIADQLLGREGRMVKAVKGIGIGLVMSEALPFRIEVSGH